MGSEPQRKLTHEERQLIRHARSEHRKVIAERHRRVEDELERKAPITKLHPELLRREIRTRVPERILELVPTVKGIAERAETMEAHEQNAEVEAPLRLAEITCDVENCNHVAKNASGLKIHKARKHGIEGAERKRARVRSSRATKKQETRLRSISDVLHTLESLLAQKRDAEANVEESRITLVGYENELGEINKRLEEVKKEISRMLDTV